MTFLNCHVSCRLRVLVLALCLELIGATLPGQEIAYDNPRDLRVQGHWNETSDALRVFPSTLELDLNQDGIPDVGFHHQLTPRQRRFNFEATQMVETALLGIEDSIDLVLGMRRYVIDAAYSSANDQDALAHAQSRLDNALDAMHRIATRPFQGQGLLDGSRGFDIDAVVGGVVPISATGDTEIGSHAIEVTTAGERATVTARTEQSFELGRQETLVINGVAVSLKPNMTQSQVIDEINKYRLQTGVFADIGAGGATRLSSERFGATAAVTVVSNSAASHSTGFGIMEIKDVGVNAVVEVSGNAYTSRGNILTAMHGPVQGISLQIPVERSDPTTTRSGFLGTITVTDHSPTFTLDTETGESVSVTIPNLRPAALGQTNDGLNQFANLDQIRIGTASQVNDALAIIDHVYEDLKDTSNQFSDLILLNAYPYGEAYLEGLEGAEFATNAFGLLGTGSEIGPSLAFQDDRVKLQSSKFIPQLEQSGFVGVRLPSPEGWLYGWIGVKLHEDSAFTVTDYAWNTTPGQPLITGVTASVVDKGPIPGDSNFDDLVDFDDFLNLSANFGGPGVWSQGDFNNDEFVDFTDFLILSANFQRSSMGPVGVPEPSGHEGVLAVVGLVAWRCRRRNTDSPVSWRLKSGSRQPDQQADQT